MVTVAHAFINEDAVVIHSADAPFADAAVL